MAGLFVSVRKIIDLAAILVVGEYLSVLRNTENGHENTVPHRVSLTVCCAAGA